MYTLILERLERHVLAERHVAAVMRAAGAKRVQVPTWENYRARLDRELGADLHTRRTYDTDTEELITAVGLGR